MTRTMRFECIIPQNCIVNSRVHSLRLSSEEWMNSDEFAREEEHNGRKNARRRKREKGKKRCARYLS